MIFLNRKLTDIEQSFRDNHRCIACGVKVKKKVTNGKDIWPWECTDCMRLRTSVSHPTTGQTFGAMRASIQRCANEELGYTNFDCGVSARTAIEDDEKEHRDQKGRLKLALGNGKSIDKNW